jgi:hypothetical protein
MYNINRASHNTDFFTAQIHKIFYFVWLWGEGEEHAEAYWLRHHVMSWEVAGSISDVVNEFYQFT